MSWVNLFVATALVVTFTILLRLTAPKVLLVTLQTRCLHGYIFVVNDNNPRQMIDEQGRGVKCEEG